MTSAAIDDLAATLATAGESVANVRQDQWNARTPCPEWDVRELVTHMVMGNRLFTGILRAEASAAPAALEPSTAGDVLGDDPAGTYSDVAADLLAAFRNPGVLERTFQVPAGTVPGVAAAYLRVVEELVHGWDLAHATGQQPRFADDIVHRATEFTRSKLADVPPERSPFASPQPAPDHASPIDRLAALLGRSVPQSGMAAGR